MCAAEHGAAEHGAAEHHEPIAVDVADSAPAGPVEGQVQQPWDLRVEQARAKRAAH